MTRWGSQSVERFACDSIASFLATHSWRPDIEDSPHKIASEAELLSQFSFCLLGGYSITFELNVIAHEQLLMSPGLTRTSMLSHKFVSLASERLRHLPRPRDHDGYVSYRFPNAKARSLHLAALWLEANDLWSFEKLYELSSVEARELLCKCPGIGYKTASWFLRNIGHGRDLAIVDVHIHRLAVQWLLIPDGLTPQKDYLQIESRIKHYCELVGVEISSLDLAMWRYARGELIDNDSGQFSLF